jgi:2-oxoglutarate ferredoxin oxidoreductase subunit beta
MATYTVRDYANGNQPTWCPGCGDYAVLKAIQRALADLGVPPEQAVLVSGIGCSGKIGHYFGGYSIHTTHGRALPVAQGIVAARPDLTVIVAGGDGDGYGIGVGHLVHAARRNLPLTYVVMDNGVYGNTKGQTSPTSPAGYQSSTTPIGNPDHPVRPLWLAWASGATFVAQGFSGDVTGLVDLLRRAIRHPGFALVNVLSPCVVFNKTHGYEFYRQAVVPVSEPARTAAEYVALLERTDYPVGCLWEAPSVPARRVEAGLEPAALPADALRRLLEGDAEAAP